MKKSATGRIPPPAVYSAAAVAGNRAGHPVWLDEAAFTWRRLERSFSTGRAAARPAACRRVEGRGERRCFRVLPAGARSRHGARGAQADASTVRRPAAASARSAVLAQAAVQYCDRRRGRWGR
jgi:hypothetical protein